ncbi:hypothetical protein D3C80_2164110 [compost metagenome]
MLDHFHQQQQQQQQQQQHCYKMQQRLVDFRPSLEVHCIVRLVAVHTVASVQLDNCMDVVSNDEQSLISVIENKLELVLVVL